MATLDNNKNCLEFAKIYAPPGGLEPPTFRLTAERASQLRHGGLLVKFDPQFINPCLKGPFRLMMLCTSAHVLTFQNKTEIVYI